MADARTIINQAMATLDFYRGFEGSGGRTPERTREVVEILRRTSYGKRSEPLGNDAELLFAFAELVEGVYLGGGVRERLFGAAEQFKREQRSGADEAEG